MMKIQERIVQKIRQKREMLGISQECMALYLGISQNSYWKIENNHSLLTIERFLTISYILKITWNEWCPLIEEITTSYTK